jgi:hypothetical protein
VDSPLFLTMNWNVFYCSYRTALNKNFIPDIASYFIWTDWRRKV